MTEYGGPLSPEGHARLDKYGSTLDDSNVRSVIERIEDYPEIIAAVHALVPEAVTFTVGDDWPTPNACLRAATALDAIATARFGDILRAYAHAEERRFDEHGPIRQVRANRSADRVTEWEEVE